MVRNREFLVVIADGEHARFIGLDDNGVPHTNAEMHADRAHHRSSDIGSDRPGATFHSGSTAHHAIAPHHDPHELAMAAFGRQVAEEINGRAARSEFSQLLIAARARTLDVIVSELGPDALHRLQGTVQKDLVKIPDHLLWRHLRAWVRPASRVP